MSNVVEWSLASGPPIQVGAMRVTPQCRVLTLRLASGGFVWNRPTAVVVEREGRQRERLRIHDLTLTAQIAAGLMSLFMWVILTRVLRARKEHGHA